MDNLLGIWEGLDTLTDPIAEHLIKGLFKQIPSWFKKKQSTPTDEELKKQFSSYIKEVYKKCVIMPTLVFPNEQIHVDKLYTPLTIYSSGNLIIDDKGVERQEKINNFTLDDSNLPPAEFYKILIIDSAGMGKSTLMRRICLNTLKQKIRIPVLIELRRLYNKTVLEEIINQIDNLQRNFSIELIVDFIEKGNFLFLLDGYDEIPHDVEEKVTHELKTFITQAGNNHFILTSRPHEALASFSDFKKFRISSLTEEQSFELIQKYDVMNRVKIASKLISDIRGNITILREFLKNPFVVSLLYKTYNYSKNLPAKKTTFFDEVYNALYKDHDLSKDAYKRLKKSRLEIQDFRKVLRELAFITFREGRVEYTEQELIGLVEKVEKRLPSLVFKAYHFLEDLLLYVPLFMRDGSMIKWVHKSFQDYFMAECIMMHQDKREILTRLGETYKSDYHNMLTYYKELDEVALRKTIIYPVLNNYIEYANKQNVQNNENKLNIAVDFYLGKGLEKNNISLYELVTKWTNIGYNDDDFDEIFPFINRRISINDYGNGWASFGLDLSHFYEDYYSYETDMEDAKRFARWVINSLISYDKVQTLQKIIEKEIESEVEDAWWK